jgi:hypothetical protein
MEVLRNAYKILTRKLEGKRAENIKMDLTNIRWEDVDWIHYDNTV